MRSLGVPFRPTPLQLLMLCVVLAAIAASTIGISFLYTVRNYAALAPHEGKNMHEAIGGTLEGMKIVFGVIGLHLLLFGVGLHRLCGLALLAFSFSLSYNSIVATIGSLVQDDIAAQHALVTSSPAYIRDEQRRDEIRSEKRVLKSASKDNRHRLDRSTKADKQLDEVATLNKELMQVEARLRDSEANPSASQGGNYFGKMAAALPELGLKTGEEMQLKQAKFNAWVIELGSMISITLLVALVQEWARTRARRIGCAPPLEVVRDNPQKSPRGRDYPKQAARVRNDKIATGRGDTSVDLANPNSARFRRILSGWANDTLGTTYKALQKAERMSPRQAGECIHAALELGALRKSGKGFKVVKSAPCFERFAMAA